MFFQSRWFGNLYIGSDQGYGCVVYNSPKTVKAIRREYVERTREERLTNT